MNEFMQKPTDGSLYSYLRAGIPYESGVEALQSIWGYMSTDPYAVHVTFRRECGEVVHWAFGRELLLTALSNTQDERIGLGDIQFTTGDALSASYDQLTLHLRSHEDSSEVAIYIGRSGLSQFIEESMRIVALGSESPIITSQIESEWELFAANPPEDGY